MKLTSVRRRRLQDTLETLLVGVSFGVAPCVPRLQQHLMKVAKDRRRFFVSQLVEGVTSSFADPEALPRFLASPLATMVPPSFLPAAMSQRLVAQRTLFSWILKVPHWCCIAAQAMTDTVNSDGWPLFALPSGRRGRPAQPRRQQSTLGVCHSLGVV